ncbi:MAG: hypothetical protein IJ071_08535 [Ruminococcus sp.]|nr:hypothetical protein [Ruminococcus sp.]
MNMKKITAALVSAVAIASMSAMSLTAGAANYADDKQAEGSTTTFSKYLVMDKEANVPNATFNYSIAAGAAKAATTAEQSEVYAGLGTPTITNAVFEAGDTTYDTAPTEDTVELEDTEKYAKKTVTVDFTGITFPEPGVYRYVVTEELGTGSQACDIEGSATKTLDVYVVDTNGTLSVSNYVLYNAIIDTNDYKNEGGTSSESDGKKVAGYQNSYDTNDLTFSKTVAGNQASKDKYFKFTVTIENIVAGTVFDVIGKGTTFEAEPSANTATEYSAEDMAAANGVDDNDTLPGQQIVATSGTVTKDFYLQNGQSVKINGLPAGAKYTIVEAEEDYTPSVDNSDTKKNTETDTDTASNSTGIDQDVTAAFTNTKSGTIPTGILLSIAAPAVIGLIAIGFIVTLLAKNRRKAEEE